jgi:sporulation protein YlmC with PRC-barrel domain
MKVNNPHELIGKEICDAKGNTIGTIDKCWNSWNQEYPGYFFGIKTYDNIRDTWFRGTTKLIPIYSDYIREVGERITLSKTTEELGRFWNKTVHFGPKTWPMDDLVEKPVFDRNYSRVGTFYAWTESDGTFKNYGCFVDPYLCDIWKMPFNTMMPMPTEYITDVKDTVTLNKTLDELRAYWKQYFNF